MTVIVLLVLLLVFLFVPQISKAIKANLDTLPMRFAAVFIVLAALSYDTLLALGIFMIIIYSASSRRCPVCSRVSK